MESGKTIEDITWEEVKALIPDKTSLYYVDYRESFDESMEEVQECIHSGILDNFYEKIDEWYLDSPSYAFEYLDEELKSAMVSKFNIEEDEADELYEEYEDNIRDTYCDRDDSEVFKDLLSNTGKQTMFFDTGYEMEGDSWSWIGGRVKQELKAIKKVIGIKQKDTTYDDDISMMIRQASYGGQLVIYFYDDIEEYITITDDINQICFSDAYIAVIDTSGGSGDHCHIGRHSFSLPFNRENIFICEIIKYSYTYSVCGMSSDWCSNTGVSFSTKKTKKVTEKSSTHIHLYKEKEYNLTFKQGSCTAGDMDINRHRKAFYINDYPCGNKCQDCGTFWID